jgi:hypothetical protein
MVRGRLLRGCLLYGEHAELFEDDCAENNFKGVTRPYVFKEHDKKMDERDAQKTSSV